MSNKVQFNSMHVAVYLCIVFHEVHFLQHDKITYDDYLTLIEYSKKHSVTYGNNRKSPLMQLPEFDITECLPFDIMYTVL